MSHRHFDESELVELALAPASDARRAELGRCPRCAEELAALEGLVARTRGALADLELVDAHAAARVARRALARTTREDPSLVGDLRLVGGYVAGELRRSRLLRLVAASLLVHLLALPVLAWYGLVRARTEPLTIRLETPITEEPFAEPEVERLEPLEPFDLATGGELDLRSEDARVARARLGLEASGALRLPASRADESAVERLLRARVEQARRPASAPDSLPAPRTALEHALVAELWLDRLVLDGRAPAELAPSLAALAEEIAAPAPAERRVVLAALQRALELGALSAEGRALVARERASGAWDPGSPGAGTRALADPAWLDALERALPPAERQRPVVRAWLDAR